ncbi:unnamed protein product [Rotaria sordida]|uniref:Uncharacterized protein n=1 Tax=Rotaria sordida TaxID=392033 RepID=A0A818TDJ0_9BILA|nr:unnamed protein product [Rotaria sordida]CAF0929096.1 unnamed protein product [Rotaria sordida]CAF0984401.1 unnamed protein product [Rotaria sordida]CAF1212425.1 unnamed protein product [Rotaria sordida]CAF1217047.1 unnamed protein product [Rotaria sordida]
MDVLMELFKYFYVDELFYLFNDIIHQFPLLLKKENVQLHVHHIDAYFRKHILPNIEINNVISIRIKNMYHMAPVNLGQFNQVRLLILHNVTGLNWPSHFPNNLKHLIIYARSKDREEVFTKALCLDNIEKLEFNSTFLHFHDCHDILVKPSTIKHLVFNSQRCFIDYQFLLNNMPYLQSLRSTNTYYPHRFNTNLGIFNYLHTIDLICTHIDIDTMIFFLTNIVSNSLRRCRLININSSLSTNIAYVLIS